MKKSFLCLLSLTALPSSISYAQTANGAINDLQNKRFDKAIKALNGDLTKLANKDLTEDQLLLLRARAFGYSGQGEKVIEIVDQLVEKHPKSKWLQKAKFLKAQALAGMKKHDEASAIYKNEAQRLFSKESKNSGSVLLMRVADSFSREINPDAPSTAHSEDKPKPDLRKADTLLKEAYEMDCSDKLKEEILAKRIMINTRAQSWAKVSQLCYLYLEQFDSTWQGKLGSLDRVVSSPNKLARAPITPTRGKQQFTVKFHLAEALHRNNQRPAASLYLSELISELTQKNDPAKESLLADATWLRLMTTRSSGGNPRDLDQWVKDAQAYLKDYPAHVHASSTVYSIAVIYQNADRHKESIAAFQDYLNNRYQIKITPNPLTARPETKQEFSQRQKKANSRKEEANYRIGSIYLKNKQFDEAKKVWNETSKLYPNGARWADCQRGLVDIHYQRSLHAITVINKAKSEEEKAQKRAAAQTALEGFISAHPLDQRVPSLLYLVGNIHFIHANEIEKQLQHPDIGLGAYSLTLEKHKTLETTLISWEKLITKYPTSSYASDALYLKATILEDAGELEEAIATYKKSSHRNARNRITALISKKLIAYNNKTFTTEEKPVIKLSTRNIEEVTVSQYWLDIESYFRKGRKLEDISSLDIDLVEADKTWQYKLPKYKKLHLLESEIEIPFPNKKAGICVIKIESKDYSSTTMVMRSDIDIAVLSANNELIAYTFDARTNKPASGVELLITDKGKVVATGKTSEQGTLHLKDKKLKDITDLRVLALSKSGAATCDYSKATNGNRRIRQQSSTNFVAPTSKASAFFNQPKSFYSPGETLLISGIIRHEKNGTFVFPNKDQRDYTVTINSGKKLLYKGPITLQERGVFSHNYTLPEYLQDGIIVVRLNANVDKDPPSFTQQVRIRKHRPSDVVLDLKLNKSWAKRGDKIEGSVSAKYRWGAPFANQKIYVSLPDGGNSNDLLPTVQSDQNDSNSLALLTDENGNASFTYTPTRYMSDTTLTFGVFSETNRSQGDSESVLYDPIPFSILAASQHKKMAVGDTSNIEIKTLEPNGKAISKELNLEIIKIITVEADPILQSTRSLEKVTRRFLKEEVVQTILLTTDPKTGKVIHPLKLDKAGTYQLRISAKGVSKTERTAIARSSITIYDSTDPALLMIQQPADSEAGKAIELQAWSSMKQAVTALLTVETDTIVEKRIVKLQPGSSVIPVSLDARHCPSARIHLMVINQRKLATAQQIVRVTNPLTFKASIVTEKDFKLTHKIKLQAFDSLSKPVAADVFLNLGLREPENNRLHYAFNRNNGLLILRNASSTGLFHEGSQEAILASVRNELQRLNRAENDSIRHYANNPILSQEHVSNVQKIRKLLYRAESYYNQAQFDHAMTEYKAVLRVDPYNKAARRGMEKVNAAKSDYYRTAYDQTRAQMLMEVDNTWELNVSPTLPNIANQNVAQGYTNDQGGSTESNRQHAGLGYRNTFSTNAQYIEPPALDKVTTNNKAWSAIHRIPAEGKEITLKTEILENTTTCFLHLNGINDSNAVGLLTKQIKVPQLVKTPSLLKPEVKGLPVALAKNVTLKKGKNAVTLKLLEGAKPAKLQLAIATSPLHVISEACQSKLVSTLGSPTPLHEQHPAGQLMSLNAKLDFLVHHKHNQDHQNLLRQQINTLCSNLTLSQKRDGSWTAVQNRRTSSLLHTVVAYQALQQAKSQDISLEPSVLVKAKKWLDQQQKSIAIDHYNSRALVQYGLAASGDADFAICNRLYRERKKMDNIGKGILANTFILLDRKEFATTLLKEITDSTIVSQIEEFSLNSPTLLKALKMQAQIDLGLLKKLPQDASLLFQSDIDRGVSVRAYGELLKLQKPGEYGLFRNIIINGKETLYTRIVINGKTSSVEFSADHLKEGENTIEFVSEKMGHLSAVISGYAPAQKSLPQANFVVHNRKYYRPNLLYKGVPLSSSGTAETDTLQVGDTVRVILSGKISNKAHRHSILIEELPQGFTYLAGSLQGNHSGARKEDDHLVITYSSLPDKFRLSYTLIATKPGKFYHRPTLLSPTYDSSRLVHNAAKELSIFRKDDPDAPKLASYKINAAEHYELARLYFDDKQYAEAKQHIISYNKLKQSSEDPQLAQMLLWIETANDNPNAQLLADSFEVLTERNPDLIIPFEKILKVGKAYRAIGEFERSSDVYTATLEASYGAESYVSAVLEDQGKYALSLDYQDKLWLQYPDLGEISTSRFELGQQIYAIATNPKRNKKALGINPATKKEYTEKELTSISLDYMQEFLTHSPTHKFAADASFSIANALFALKRYKEVVGHTTEAAVTHKHSSHATSFRYMLAVGHFWLRNYDEALATSAKVAHENSEDKELATFITAQIYHAKGQPEKAIEWYKSIKHRYPDAAESIAYFEKKSISLDEVKVLNSGDKASLKLRFRNIKEAQFQIYRVDLMKLYLREKNLSNISKINLAGINPKHNLTVKLGDGKDFKEMEKTIQLPVEKDGAYLVICRGDYLYTSGLLLITPLKIEVQEYPRAREVRVNISDKKSGKYLDSVHVKAVGKDKKNIASGDTDLRGVWQGNDVSSPSTIIAKDKKGRYAFFRSKYNTSNLVQKEIQRRAMKPKVDFNQNLKIRQNKLNFDNSFKYEQKRRSKGKGVEINKARKK